MTFCQATTVAQTGSLTAIGYPELLLIKGTLVQSVPVWRQCGNRSSAKNSGWRTKSAENALLAVSHSQLSEESITAVPAAAFLTPNARQLFQERSLEYRGLSEFAKTV
jgi:hypothetical protein